MGTRHRHSSTTTTTTTTTTATLSTHTMVGILFSNSVLPRSLTQPAGIVFLDPAHRVSREELDRRDAIWRAMRERSYAKRFSEDATLVGSVRRFAVAQSRALYVSGSEWDDRTLGRRLGRTITEEASSNAETGSTLYPHSHRAPSSSFHAARTPYRRLRHPRKIKEALRRFVNQVRA